MIERIGASADEMAIAIVTACKFTGENPIAVVRRVADGAQDSHGRPLSSRAGFLALSALIAVHPKTLKRAECASALGFARRSARDMNEGLKQARRGKWWRPENVIAIIDALGGAAPCPRVAPKVTNVEARRAVTLPAVQKRDEIIDLPPMPSRHRSGYKVAPANRWDRRESVVPALGEPPAGRSALDQRRAAESGR